MSTSASGFRFYIIGLLVAGCLAACSFVFAATTGSIQGRVSDSEGNPLPGATVTIDSFALIGGSRVASTDSSGVFRFPSLPVGVYSARVTLEGFETVSIKEIWVNLDAKAYVPVTLNLATVAENLIVVAESPLLDVNDADFSSNYKDEMLENIPTQRNMWDLVKISPGMSPASEEIPGGLNRIIAFGSNIQSNLWNVNGLDISTPLLGSTWWNLNPEILEQVEVLGVGAPAEYGNHTGGVFNFVTKKGGNEFHGGTNLYYQSDALTGVNVRLPDSPYTFHRDQYRHFDAQVGGPIAKDRIWFFGAASLAREGSTEPGNDPRFAPNGKGDQYDLTLSARLSQKHELTGFLGYGSGDLAIPSPDWEASATPRELNTDWSWGAGSTSTLTQNLLLELNYAGWRGDYASGSLTGSLEDPFIDYTPPGGGNATSSGGPSYPRSFLQGRQQIGGKITLYRDRFLASRHEFRLGVQFSDEFLESTTSIGPNGNYSYHIDGEVFKVVQDPYKYGGVAHSFGSYIDDTVAVSGRLSLNLGLRFDHNTGSIPNYDVLVIGTPSVSPVGNFKETDGTVPGVTDLIHWNLLSPRLGVVYQADEEGKSVIQASFGVYYDHNVIGNWDLPAPGTPPLYLYHLNPATGEYELVFEQLPEAIQFNKKLRAPRALQYSVGYERQLSGSMVGGVQYVYKDTTDLIGWEISGGAWEPVAFVDPVSGKAYTLWNQVQPPQLQKGNQPGDFPGSEGLRYFEKYHGIVFTFEKRFSANWGVNASYTWSKSYGVLPTPLSQFQMEPDVLQYQGYDPNHFINAEGRLPADRPHMFRVQAVFFKLPADLYASASVDFSSGRPMTRQVNVLLNQGQTPVLLERGLRNSPTEMIDVTIGKEIHLGHNLAAKVEGTVYNLLNSDQQIMFPTPAEYFMAPLWVQPRRLQLRVGLQF